MVSKSPSYTISAKENITLTATFAPLDEGETVWEFTDMADNDALTTTTEKAQKTYGNFEIYLAAGGDSEKNSYTLKKSNSVETISISTAADTTYIYTTFLRAE